MTVVREIKGNLCRKEEGADHQKTNSKCWCCKTGQPLNAKHIVSCCKRESFEISARQNIVTFLLNNILIQRGLIAHEQVGRPEDGEDPQRRYHHWNRALSVRGVEWQSLGSKLKPDLVWLRRDSDGQWTKAVVDVKITSTDKLNDAYKEKDDKYRVWATCETREKKVAKAVMVPHISHDGAVHKDSVRRWKDFAPDIKVDWVRMAQNVLRYNVAIVGKFFNKGSWSSEALRKRPVIENG